MVNSPEFQSSDPRLFPGRREYDLFFDVNKVNPLLKNNGGGTEALILFFFVVWSALIVSR